MTTKTSHSSKKQCAFEQSSNPIWMKQARELAWLLLPEPMNVKEIQREARRCFGWMPGRVVQILAAGEGIYFYFKQCAPDEMGQWCLSENMKGVPV